MFAFLALVVLVMQAAVPTEWSTLWLAAAGGVTALLTQLLKKAAAPLEKAPDIIKATVAFLVSFISVKGAALLGVPIPPTLSGVAGVIVTWASSMGLHALAKKVGVVTDIPAVAP